MKRKTIRAIIVDDELPARRLLQRRLETDPAIDIVAVCRNGAEAVGVLQEQPVDVAFLDIQMPGVDGFELIDRVGIDKMPLVVFVTAYDEYAVKAFEQAAVDYLLKPFTTERLGQSVDRVKNRLRRASSTESQKNLRHLLEHWSPESLHPEKHGDESNRYMQQVLVRDGNRLRTLPVSKVLYITSEDHYIRVHAADSSYLVYEQLSAAEARLDPTAFVRIHRQTIVNLSHVTRIESTGLGGYTVKMANGSRLKVARSRRATLAQLLSAASDSSA